MNGGRVPVRRPAARPTPGSTTIQRGDGVELGMPFTRDRTLLDFAMALTAAWVGLSGFLVFGFHNLAFYGDNPIRGGWTGPASGLLADVSMITLWTSPAWLVVVPVVAELRSRRRQETTRAELS